MVRYDRWYRQNKWNKGTHYHIYRQRIGVNECETVHIFDGYVWRNEQPMESCGLTGLQLKDITSNRWILTTLGYRWFNDPKQVKDYE